MKEAIKSTIDICVKEGNLVEYLKSHRREVEDSTMFFISQEELDEARMEIAREEGMEEGFTKGHAEGHYHGIETVIIQALQKGRSPEEVADFTDLPLAQVMDVYSRMEMEAAD